MFLLQTPDFAGANVQPTVSAVTSSETLKTTPSAAIADTTVTGEAKPTKDNHISGFVATLIAYVYGLHCNDALFIIRFYSANLRVSLLFVCYFVFGAMYKRVVLGAQGVEQIPNYLFWRRCCRRVQVRLHAHVILLSFRSVVNQTELKSLGGIEVNMRIDRKLSVIVRREDRVSLPCGRIVVSFLLWSGYDPTEMVDFSRSFRV